MDKHNKAVFLDRDGTINVDTNYLYHPSEFIFLPDVITALQILQSQGYYLIIITNQSGIARGFYSENDYLKIDYWLKQVLLAQGVKITASYYCPHLDSKDALIRNYRVDCDCRKPKTGMFMSAVEQHGIDLSASFAIGDRLRDLSICSVSECRGYLINTTEPVKTINQVKSGVYSHIKYKNNLLESVEDIINIIQ